MNQHTHRGSTKAAGQGRKVTEKHRISSSWRRGGRKHERGETSKERIVRNVNAKVAPELSNESVCRMEITGGYKKKAAVMKPRLWLTYHRR